MDLLFYLFGLEFSFGVVGWAHRKHNSNKKHSEKTFRTFQFTKRENVKMKITQCSSEQVTASILGARKNLLRNKYFYTKMAVV